MPPPPTLLTDLVAVGLGAVVDDDGPGEVTAQDVQVLHVGAVHAHTVVTEQPVPREDGRSGNIGGWWVR